MFYDVFIELCHKKDVAPTRAALDMGLSKSAPIKWRTTEATPQGETLNKIASYFDVSTDYLLGKAPQDEELPAPTKKDERDIARDLQRMREQLEGEGTLMFEGNPMSLEARESILAAVKLGLEAAKIHNKQKYTPRKYKKE